jgi:excisionase family DNA binding protein
LIDEEYYTPADIAKRLKVSEETVRRWLRSGDLKGLQFGRRGGFRVPASALHEFLERKLAA